ncbi:MAG: hypothetical protein KF681_08760 [Bdellovibrionaceae bacterium]|nr:hypothetical protein [Pseudobdellovibrionaceae bacterium]
MVDTLIFAFVTHFAAAGEIKLDASQIQSWGSKSTYPCKKLPFIATYQKDGKTFKLFAADHAFGATPESDPGLQKIKETIEQFKPKSLVIESAVEPGQFSGPGLSRQESGCRVKNDFVCGESFYAGLIAGKSGAVVTGGEQSPNERNKRLLASGWSSEEVKAYNSLLILSSMRAEGALLEERKRRLMSDPENQDSFLGDASWSYAKLDAYLKRIGAGSADDIDSSWIAPVSGADSTPTQKLAAKNDSQREPIILAAAEKAINSSSNSMMVYGASHFVKQARALAAAFGPPSIQCLADGGGSGLTPAPSTR